MTNEKRAVNDDPPTPPDIEWTAMTRAVAQVLVGNVMIIAGVGSIVFQCYLGTVSTGIWVGATVLATGMVGMVDAARYSTNVRYTYVIMLITSMILSLIMIAIEVAAYLIDHERCGYVRPSTTAAPTEYPVPLLTHYHTVAPPVPVGCVIECKYAHEGLAALAVVDFVGAAACIYYAGNSLRRHVVGKSAEAIPYESMPSQMD